MPIRELRAAARNALKGNLMKIAIPLTIILIFNFLLSLGFEFLVEEIFDFDVTLILITSIIFCAILVIVSTILQFGIIKRIIKVSREEESNFFVDTFSAESIKASFSILWGFIKKYAIWMVLIILPIILSLAILEFATVTGPSSPFVVILGILSYLSYVGFIIAIIMLIIISYRYMFVYYLKHDYPDKSTKELFEKSRMMMRGNKAKAFLVPITMIGWFILFFVSVFGLAVGIEFIWPSEVYYTTVVSTVPLWANILCNFVIYFLLALITSYINMTYYQLYMEQKPLEIYNDDYLKPETNAKKYIWILFGVFVAIFLVHFLVTFLMTFWYMNSFLYDAYNI